MIDYTKFTYFWRETDENGCFSQWFESRFGIDKIIYNTAEQFMMAEKARLFNDVETEKLIMQAKEPRLQKRFGRAVQNFNAEKWNAVCKSVVYDGNYAKFTQNPVLLEKLIATDGTLLVEASPYDATWGCGLIESDILAGKKWTGTNWLGEILTNLRENIKAKI